MGIITIQLAIFLGSSFSAQETRGDVFGTKKGRTETTLVRTLQFTAKIVTDLFNFVGGQFCYLLEYSNHSYNYIKNEKNERKGEINENEKNESKRQIKENQKNKRKKNQIKKNKRKG